MAVGFGLGFLVALQLGPVSLLLVRSTLRAGWLVGLAMALGVALVDGAYAAAGAAGAAGLLQVAALRVVLGLLGAAVLVALGVRALLAARAPARSAATPVLRPGRAFRTAVTATAANPLTVASWAAVFPAAAVGTTAGAVPVVVGVALGSLTWMALLATAVAVLRRGVTPSVVRAVDAVSGAGLVAFGVVLAVRATG